VAATRLSVPVAIKSLSLLAPEHAPLPSSRKPPPLHRWRISLPAATLGYVEAPDAKSAINKAIEEFHIKDPQKRRWLVCAVASLTQ
jgi:hypothetical protein